MKSFFRMTLLVLVLLLVALVSALTAMRLAIHGREVEVPKLVGLTPTEADRAAAAVGLQLIMERQYYSPQIPEGKVMSQLPEAGTHVRRGWQLRVAESLGPQRVVIPDVLGQSGRAADLNIRRRGLDVGAVAQIAISDTPADRVISQSPPPNASGISAPKISLLITTTPEPQSFVMANFVGQPLGSATTALVQGGMLLGTVGIATQPAVPNTSTSVPLPAPIPQASPASIIVMQSPAPGQKVAAGITVNFEVKP
ncbi:MAG: penicillin-binding protein [Acidobacteria bacterium]|nr:MAG: penicillin-binding protein [Acidobacteriota bacterium]